MKIIKKRKTMILIINSGSSSIKFKIYKKTNNLNFKTIAKGLAQRINIDGILIIEFNKKIIKTKENFINHEITIKILLQKLQKYNIIKTLTDITSIGHRIVHGGEKFIKSVIISNKILLEMEKIGILAPLHNYPSLMVIKICQNIFNIPNVAVFDTSFHTSIPIENFIYSIPYEWYINYKIRRYGFHGISYRYIINKFSKIVNKPISKINAIICHLGNGSSICSIKNGKSFNTSMGLSPLEGLIMGTRCGDIDPSIHEYVNYISGKNIKEINNILNTKSGLLGISGVSSDIRDLFINKNDERSKLALYMTAKRIAKYIISYINELKNKIDGIIFTGGIGENSSKMRWLVSQEISLINFKLNNYINKMKYKSHKLISHIQATFPIYKIKTNEEIIICEDTYNLTNKNK